MMPFFKLLSLKLLFALLILVQTFFIQIAMANDDYPVGIKPDLPFVPYIIKGKKLF